MLKGKRFLALALTLMTILTPVSKVFAYGVYISEEKTLIKGVGYKHIEMLTESGWQDIYVVTADLKEPHLAFNVLKDPRGESYLLNPLEMAKNADAVAAINADFFAAKRGQTGRGSAVGMEVIDGGLMTTPSVDEKMNVLYQLSDDSKLFLNSFEFDITITAPNGETDKIRHINKYDDLTSICLYTRDWNDLSQGSGNGMFELIVEDSKVIDKRWAHDPVAIPENGYVLSSHLSYNDFLDRNFNLGDEVKIDIKSTPDYTKIKNAVGGGGVLVNAGVPMESFSHNITGLNPRSAVGIDKSGTFITLAAVDGRLAGAAGMTQAELGRLMAQLGCEYALNLDGGGSTLLAIKTDEGHVVANKPSDSYKRPVTNSIGITTTAGKEKTSYIEIKSDSDSVFNNTSSRLRVEGYDKYYRKTEDIPIENVTFNLESGDGHMDNNVFYPKSAGNAHITAQYGEYSSYIDLVVLEKPYRIEFETDDIPLLSGETFRLKLNGYDASGKKAVIYPEDVNIEVSDDCASIAGTTVSAHSSGSAILTASLGGVSANAVVSIDGAPRATRPDNISLPDDKQRYAPLSSDNAFKFTVFGNMTSPKKLIDLFAVNKAIYAMKDSGELHSFLGNIDTNLMSIISENSFMAKGHTVFEHKGSTFLMIKNDKGDILSSDKKQWENIKKCISDVGTGNLFVFMDNAGVSTFDTETRVLKSMLEEAAGKGSSVFVFGGGKENEIKTENNVRYITSAGIFSNIGINEGERSIKDIVFFEVTVNGSDVSFEKKQIIN